MLMQAYNINPCFPVRQTPDESGPGVSEWLPVFNRCSGPGDYPITGQPAQDKIEWKSTTWPGL